MTAEALSRDLASERHHERLLVDRALEGDGRAFRSIVEAHHRPLFLMAQRLVGSSTEAQDLVQDSFAKAYCSLASFDPTFRLGTWLHRITLNTCRDHLKSAKRRERPTDAELLDRADEAPDPEEQLVLARRAYGVRQALDALRPSYREVLVLKDLHGLSYQEIKAITGTPITALKIRVVRARRKLRLELEARP